jgi:hypothetical protein
MRRGLIKLSDAARPSVIMGIMLLRWAAGRVNRKEIAMLLRLAFGYALVLSLIIMLPFMYFIDATNTQYAVVGVLMFLICFFGSVFAFSLCNASKDYYE